MKLDFDSRLRMFIESHEKDIINKLLIQLNKNRMLITNPIVGNLRIRTLADLTKKSMTEASIQSVLDLLNSERYKP